MHRPRPTFDYQAALPATVCFGCLTDDGDSENGTTVKALIALDGPTQRLLVHFYCGSFTAVSHGLLDNELLQLHRSLPVAGLLLRKLGLPTSGASIKAGRYPTIVADGFVTVSVPLFANIISQSLAA
ncbi:hypothetical protein LEM8419_00786 [Neolewinella maritima]|uniref:Uncharacterized protein n=1 Tax=Neolewinella maritima TaxID=1383882 RepID=A0ABM9AYC0_9BACT|nr:hypothetical protein LEM8419_00786 [Neolewinella maritima]